MSRRVFTIGYEGATQADVIARLKAAGVDLLVDVRAVAASRRAGFSKTILGESPEGRRDRVSASPRSRHPKAGRDAARKGRIGEMRDLFEDHLQEPAARLQFERLKAEASGNAVALLCFEADHAGCHRAVLAERLASQDGFEIITL
jgi:uncharacterized protein (DUF488 family)